MVYYSPRLKSLVSVEMMKKTDEDRERDAEVPSSIPKLELKIVGDETSRSESRFLQDMQSPKSFSSVESLRARNLDVDGFYSAAEDEDEEEEESNDDDDDSFEPTYGGAWQHEIDRHGRSYVFNRSTGESRWLENDEPTSPPTAQEVPILSPLFAETPRDSRKRTWSNDKNRTIEDVTKSQLTWTPYTDENGYTYYYNETTGASRWTLPEETDTSPEKSIIPEVDTFLSELNDAETALAEISVELAGTTSPKSYDESGEVMRLRESLRQSSEREALYETRIREVETKRESEVSRLMQIVRERDEEIRAMRGEMVVMELREKNLRSLILVDGRSSISESGDGVTNSEQEETRVKSDDNSTPQDQKQEVVATSFLVVE